MINNDFANVFSDTTSPTMDTNRNSARRVARHDDAKEFSNHSVLRAMENFVQSVNDMDETILVPCRLMDLKVCDDTTCLKEQRAKRMLKEMSSTDLYSLYTMVNSVKNELLWGRSSGPEEPTSTVTATSSPAIKGHVRRHSTVSMTSIHSTVSCSDTDSEAGNENDSGVEGEEDYAQQVAENFRQHLNGLYHCLEQMTDAANYITTRYQNDIGGAV